jgi:hypothetical protein
MQARARRRNGAGSVEYWCKCGKADEMWKSPITVEKRLEMGRIQ